VRLPDVIVCCALVLACRGQNPTPTVRDAQPSAVHEVPRVSEKMAINVATEQAQGRLPALVRNTVARADLRPDAWRVVFVNPAINTKGMKGGDLEVLVDKNTAAVLRFVVHQ
jgi:hypothetical protein